MKATAKIIITAIVIISLAGPAWAGTIKKRQVHQQQRIHQGVVSGELTKKECISLEKQQRRIQRAKKAAWSDGSLNKAERVRLHTMQENSSARIYRLKHNDAAR